MADNSNNQQTLKEKLRGELEKSILLDESDRKYWLKALPDLPEESVRAVLKDISGADKQIDKYLMAALENDPKIISKLKSKTNRIKEKAYEIDQKSESKNAEANLADKLKQI